jgi:phenylacetic acid degradation operon negative regulatory protein
MNSHTVNAHVLCALYESFLLRNPNLPNALLPTAWSGLEARQSCQVLYQEVKAASEAYWMETVQTLEEALVATPTVFAQR